MNPRLEEHWRDVHVSLLVYARDQLAAELPEGLHARIDERLEYLPDVAVAEPWDHPCRAVLGVGGSTVKAAEPEIVELDQLKARHLEIVDSREHVITVIEVLSPTNKGSLEMRNAWREKRINYLRGGINLVELDLLRNGGWILPERGLLRPIPTDKVYYQVCVTRPPRVNRHEFYTTPLREPLPTIRVPLRPSDPDVALNLQSLIDECYERGRYGTQIRYNKPPNPPLPEEDAAWAHEMVLRAKTSG